MRNMSDVHVKVLNRMKIPSIGLGTWEASGSDLEIALDVALEYGYRHIDTAYVYNNEETIGKVLKKWFSSGKLRREDVFITTKLPMGGVHEDRVNMFMERSLRNLDLEYVDLYLIHFPVGTNCEGVLTPLSGQLMAEKSDHIKIWKKMEEQVTAGRVKYIGLSNFNEKQIRNILNNCTIKPACLQVEVHLHMQQNHLVDYCHMENIAVVAYCPLGSPSYNQYRLQMGLTEKQLPRFLDDPTVKAIAEKHNKSTGQIALRYLIERSIIPIPKSVNPSRIKENFEVFDFYLDDEDMRILEKLNVGESARICDMEGFPQIEQHLEWPFPKRSNRIINQSSESNGTS